MRALSVRQPYAEHIASGRKSVEVRTWITHYRGPLVIVASARACGNLPAGVTVCVVDLLDIRRPIDSDYAAACLPDDCDLYDERDWCWILGNPRRVVQVPTKGRLGLYDVADVALAPRKRVKLAGVRKR